MYLSRFTATPTLEHIASVASSSLQGYIYIYIHTYTYTHIVCVCIYIYIYIYAASIEQRADRPEARVEAATISASRNDGRDAETKPESRSASFCQILSANRRR